MISINAPQIGMKEVEAVVKVLKSGLLTHGQGAGPSVSKFEKEYAKAVNTKHAIATNTGTAALHLAITSAGIESGDEVILPSFTFVATAEVIVMVGAKPIFVDIDPQTYNISPEEVAKAITKKTKAVMPVDLYGLSADLQQIREIAGTYGLLIIEDAAQAHGTIYKEKYAGAFADTACWSFYASKNMTTGEGGMITTNNDEMADKTRVMRSHGEKEKYKSLMLGFNYRMSEIQAAIGCVQLEKLPKFLSKRRKNVKRLTEILQRAERLQLPVEPQGYKHSWYLYTVRLKAAKEKDRNRILQELWRNNIGAEAYYKNPVHLMPYYHDFCKHELPETEKAAKQVFSLPIHPGVTAEQIERIGETVLQLLDKQKNKNHIE